MSDELKFRGDNRDDLFRQMLAEMEGVESATAYMCRGEYRLCKKHIKGKRAAGKPACDWCAKVHLTSKTTVEDMHKAVRLDS